MTGWIEVGGVYNSAHEKSAVPDSIVFRGFQADRFKVDSSDTCWGQSSLPEINMTGDSKHNLLKAGAGALCLVVIGVIVWALWPKKVSGAQAGPAVVEVVQVEQKDVPIYGE